MNVLIASTNLNWLGHLNMTSVVLLANAAIAVVTLIPIRVINYNAGTVFRVLAKIIWFCTLLMGIWASIPKLLLPHIHSRIKIDFLYLFTSSFKVNQNKSDHSVAFYNDILLSETIDEEYSKLAICLKEGGISSYTIAYKCIQAMIKGLSDRNNV